MRLIEDEVMSARSRASGLLWLCDMATVLGVLCLAPVRWRNQFGREPVSRIFDAIEADVKRHRAISIAPETIAYLVRRRTILTVRWRRTRCLLRGMLLQYLLARAGWTITLHIGCDISDASGLVSHCWISSPDLTEANYFMSSDGMKEIYCKTVFARSHDGAPG